MRLLVTGSSGQIGSYVVDAARSAGHEVRGLDLRPSAWTDQVGDVRDHAAAKEAMAGIGAVVHCAAQVSVPLSVQDPANDASHNVLGTVRLLQAAREAGIRRFVNVSSAAVYGEPAELPLRESSPTQPLSPYGSSKLAAESYARLFRSLHGMEAVSVRPFNVYSRRQDPSSPYSGVLSRFADRVRAGQAPIVLGDGLQTRDFVHAQDVAAWMLDLAVGPAPPFEVVNLATGTSVTLLDVARLFLKAAGRDPAVEFGPARPGDIRHSAADTTLATARGLKPSKSLAEGVRELVEDMWP